MEMLIRVLIGVIGFFTALSIPFIGWVGISIVDLKVDVAETHAKVDANYQMIRPMWEQFISEKTVANFAVTNLTASE
jgi:hypothetical protein